MLVYYELTTLASNAQDVQHSGSRRAISVRETLCRLKHSVSSLTFLFRQQNEYDISTAKPANVNDADLGFDLIVPDNPISVPTDMCVLKFLAKDLR